MQLASIDTLFKLKDELMRRVGAYDSKKETGVFLFQSSRKIQGKRHFFDSGLSKTHNKVIGSQLMRSGLNDIELFVYTQLRHPHLMAAQQVSPSSVTMPLMTTDVFLLFNMHVQNHCNVFGRVTWEGFNPARMFVNITRAAHQLNKYHIAHCDIRLSNILVNVLPDGTVLEDSVRLGDFNMAMKHDDVLKNNVVVNPTITFAPEIHARNPVSNKTDVFMLGSTLIMLLIGYVVHASDIHTVELRKNGVKMDFSIWGGVEAAHALFRLARQCISIDQSKRPTLHAFETEVEGIIGGFCRS